MYAHPLTDPTRVQREELTPAHLAAARTMASRSMVLLNDNNNALPLSTSLSSVAVVGPLADNAPDQLGPDVPIGYSATDLKSGGLRAGRHQGGGAERDRDLRAGL
jgi:beta-glucosidase-like glycosyl hydrolase